MKKILEGGAEIDMTLVPFQVGNRLLKAVLVEVESVKFSMGQLGKIDEDVLNTIKNLVARLVCSSAVEDVLWECMARTTYGGNRITKDTFEDEKVRGDYLLVAKEVLWFNLIPFFKNLSSPLKAVHQKIIDSQKSSQSV